MSSLTQTDLLELTDLVVGAVSFPAQNENWRRLERSVAMVLSSIGESDPPGSPVDQTWHFVGSSPTGAWAGQAGKLAWRYGGEWAFVNPWAGLRAYDATAGAVVLWNGTAFVQLETWAESVAAANVGAGVTSIELLQNGIATRTQLGVQVDVDCQLYAVGVHAIHVDGSSPPTTWALRIYRNGSGTASIDESFDWPAAAGTPRASQLSVTPLALSSGDYLGVDAAGSAIDSPAIRATLKFRSA